MASIMNINGIISSNTSSLAFSELAEEEMTTQALLDKSIYSLYDLDSVLEGRLSWEECLIDQTLISKWKSLIP